MSDLLNRLKEEISHKISNLNYVTWIAPITEFKQSEGVFSFVVPNNFIADWIDDHYHDLIEEELFELTGEHLRVAYEVKEGNAEHAADGKPAGAHHSVDVAPPPVLRTPSAQLNPKYTFNRFVVGSSNQFAHAACKAAAEMPGGRYNPLFLYGGVGLGKTHLLQAVGNEIALQFPALNILYVSAERFMNELINAIRFEKTADFRKKYRENCDVLLMDDVQFIAGKDRTQDEFFHTFNALHDAQKQLVMTSDRFPKEMEGLEERIRSRLEWGLISDIQPPDFETRVAILRKKADSDNLVCPDDVAMFLASTVKANVRELEGSLIRVNAFASLSSAPVSIDLAKEVLRNLMVAESRSNGLSVEGIQKAVANFYKVTVADLKSPRRVKTLAHPRQIAMYLCKKLSGCSFPEIGDKFGGKDHTTVMHACKKIEGLLKNDARLQNDLHSLEKIIQH